MDDLINMMVSNESPSSISDKIKDILLQKSAQNIETIRPIIANSIVNGDEESTETEVDSTQDELQTPEESEEETD